MRHLRIIVAILVVAVSAFSAKTALTAVESLKLNAEADFNAGALKHVSPVEMPSRVTPATQQTAAEEPLMEEPTFVKAKVVGPLIGSFVMADRLDAHRSLFNLQLGAQNWDISLASDKSFKVLYLTFAQKDNLVFSRIKDLNELRGAGVISRIDAQTSYRFKVNVNYFDPIRGSTLNIDPVNGTDGPSHSMKTGELLDQIKEKSFSFEANGKEFWLLYGTDVNPSTDKLADTRSLLFIHESGLNSKAYPVAESRLKTGEAIQAQLGDTAVILVKNAKGELEIHAGSNLNTH